MNFLRNARWLSGALVAIFGGSSIALAWWLGWIGIGPSVVGLAVAIATVVMLVLELLAYWLADQDYNLASVILATLIGGVVVALVFLLAPVIGFGAALATTALIVIWTGSVSSALFLRI